MQIVVANQLPESMYPTLTYKQYMTPLKYDEALVNKSTPAVELLMGPGHNMMHPPVMESKNFDHLVKSHPDIANDYILFGVAHPVVFKKVLEQGKVLPFSNHNGNFEVDLFTIPIGTAFGATALVQAFQR